MQVDIGSIITVAVLLLGSFAWLIRLEAKVIYLEKDHDEHKANGDKKITDMWLKIESILSTLNQVAQGVARLEGQITKK